MTGEKEKRGPKEDRVKVDVPWEEAVGAALKKKKPKEGWPTAPAKKPEKKPDK